MEKFIVALKNLLLSVNLVAVMTVMGAIVAIFVDIALVPIEKVIVILLIYIITSMLLEKLTIAEKTKDSVFSISTLLQSLVIRNESTQDFVLFPDDPSAQELVRTISHNKTLRKVEILSSGLTSRQELIPMWLNAGVPVDALVQDFDTALDKKDKEKIVVAVDWIHRQSPTKLNLLTLKFHINISTIRAIVLHEKNTQTKHIFLSWYYYYDANKKIEGTGNPILYCSTNTKSGIKTYDWLSKVIQINLHESKQINAKELLDE